MAFSSDLPAQESSPSPSRVHAIFEPIESDSTLERFSKRIRDVTDDDNTPLPKRNQWLEDKRALKIGGCQHRDVTPVEIVIIPLGHKVSHFKFYSFSFSPVH